MPRSTDIVLALAVIPRLATALRAFLLILTIVLADGPGGDLARRLL